MRGSGTCIVECIEYSSNLIRHRRHVTLMMSGNISIDSRDKSNI